MSVHECAVNDPVLDSSSSVGARRRDNTLASLLHEAFKLLELRFKTYDHDGAGQKLDGRCPVMTFALW